MKILAIVFALSVIVALPAAQAQDGTHEDQSTPKITKEEAEQLQLALDRGLKLYQYDQAAWHTTDALLEEIADPVGAGIKGWVIEPIEEGWRATFWSERDEKHHAVFTAIYDGRKIVSRKYFRESLPLLSEAQEALLVAQRAIEASAIARCSDMPFNQVVFPTGQESGGYFVYLLVPQSRLDSVHLGGHYRFEVIDGKVVDQRQFTNSCLELSFASEESSERPVALGITHLLDPVPTEIHVFSTFVAGVPINVMTSQNQHIWVAEISGGQPRVRLIK